MTKTKPRILFVDDDINILKALARLLHGRCSKWNIDFIDSAKMAIQMTNKHHFDVVVTDMAMPDMTGFELVQALNKTSPETRCIILTGTADLQMTADIINTVDVFRFYTKPCDTETLIKGISAGLTDGLALPVQSANQNHHRETMVLDKLPTGVLVATDKGEVVYMNQSAAEIIALADGLCVGHDQVLRASNSDGTENLREAFVQLSQDQNHDEITALSIERPSLREALKLMITPIMSSDKNSEGRAIIFITDPNKQTFPSTEMIGRYFNLTPKESRLAWELIRGQRTDDIAVTMGITVSSVRTYLKRIMEKTRTNRQVDLVRLLLSTPQINTFTYPASRAT